MFQDGNCGFSSLGLRRPECTRRPSRLMSNTVVSISEHMKDGPILDAMLANFPSSEGCPCFIRLLIGNKSDFQALINGHIDIQQACKQISTFRSRVSRTFCVSIAAKKIIALKKHDRSCEIDSL